MNAGFFDVLLANLSRPSYFIRRDAAVVLGRLFREAAPTLVELYPRCIERDPLLIAPLLTSLLILSTRARRRHWAYVRVASTSRSYLTRWAALEIVVLRIWDQQGYDAEQGETILRLLAGDPHPLVRAEATFFLRERQVRAATQTSAPDQRREVLQALSAEQPRLMFGVVEGTFTNYLWSEQIDDYDLDLLDAWVRHREQHPWSADVQPDRDAVVADYRRFTREYESGEADGATAPG